MHVYRNYHATVRNAPRAWTRPGRKDLHVVEQKRTCSEEPDNTFVLFQVEFIDASQLSFIHDLGPKGL